MAETPKPHLALSPAWKADMLFVQGGQEFGSLDEKELRLCDCGRARMKIGGQGRKWGHQERRAVSSGS